MMIKALCIVLALAAILAILWMVAVRMPGRSFRGTAPASDAAFEVLRDALRRDVEYLAGPIGERNVIVESAYATAASYIEQSLREAGCATERQTFVAEGYTCTNVIGELRGTSDEIVVLGAHYDTVDESPGADDNASGVAALLALARASAHMKPRRTIRFVAFANEEPPYFMTEWMGSYQYARRCRQRGEKVVAMLSLESLGYFRDDAGSQKYPAGLDRVFPSTANFIAFASNLGSRSLLRDCIRVFRAHATVPSEGGALPETVTGVAWSDQWSFWRFGYPAIMVTDTAPFRNPNYHTAWDKPETLDYNRLARVVEGLRWVVEKLSSSA